MSSIEAPHHINIPFKERDESLVALPKNYFGPGVFRSKALYLPVYVRGILEENSGNHRASIAINLGDRQIGLEGNVAVERLAAMPSDVAKF